MTIVIFSCHNTIVGFDNPLKCANAYGKVRTHCTCKETVGNSVRHKDEIWGQNDILHVSGACQALGSDWIAWVTRTKRTGFRLLFVFPSMFRLLENHTIQSRRSLKNRTSEANRIYMLAYESHESNRVEICRTGKQLRMAVVAEGINKSESEAYRDATHSRR